MRRTLWARLAVGVMLILAAATPARPQAATDSAAAAPEPDRWAFSIDLAFTGASGNESLALLTTGAEVTHLQTERFEFEVGGRIRYGRSDTTTIANSMDGSIKFDLYPEADWSPFLFGTLERDPLRKLTLRLNGGAGVKYTFWRYTGGKASISLAGIYSYEGYEQEESPLSLDKAVEEFQRKARASWRLKGEKRFGSGFRMEHVIFWQPQVTDASNYLIDARTRLSSEITEHLSLMVDHTFRRNTGAPETVQPNDQMLTVGLNINL